MVSIGILAASGEPSDWRGRPAIEFTDPRVERTGTLRVVRFGADPRQTIDDQGTLIGWVGGDAEFIAREIEATRATEGV